MNCQCRNGRHPQLHQQLQNDELQSFCICSALSISLTDFFNFDDKVLRLREKEALLIKIFREISPMSQDTLIKVSKCMK